MSSLNGAPTTPSVLPPDTFADNGVFQQTARLFAVQGAVAGGGSGDGRAVRVVAVGAVDVASRARAYIETVLQDVFVANMWIGQPAHLFVMYVETFMLVAVFRPAMHRPFGVALIVFHFMVWLVMGIAFWYQPIQLALLFVELRFGAEEGAPSVAFQRVPHQRPGAVQRLPVEQALVGGARARHDHEGHAGLAENLRKLRRVIGEVA